MSKWIPTPTIPKKIIKFITRVRSMLLEGHKRHAVSIIVGIAKPNSTGS